MADLNQSQYFTNRMANYVYLVPGNWFDLKNINKDKTYPYDLESLKAEILNQVSNRSENLRHINLNFGNQYKNATEYDIEMRFDEAKFNKISQLLSEETRHPIISFHGTSPSAIESIFRKGYLIPGKDGVKVKHGAVYGNGVYSSPHFDKALMYSHPDESKCVYVLVNLLFLGKARLIPPNKEFGMEDKTIDTKIVFGLEQIVSTNSDKIVPVGVIKIKIG
jgi:hypothetical protein